MSYIVSRPYSKEGEDTWERVFGKKNSALSDNDRKVMKAFGVEEGPITGMRVCAATFNADACNEKCVDFQTCEHRLSNRGQQ